MSLTPPLNHECIPVHMWTAIGTEHRSGDRFFHGAVRALDYTPDGRLVVATARGWSLHNPDTLEVLVEVEVPQIVDMVPLADGSGVLWRSRTEAVRQRWSGEREATWSIGSGTYGIVEGLNGAIWVFDAGEPGTLNHRLPALLQVTEAGTRRIEFDDSFRRYGSLARSPNGRYLTGADVVVDLAIGEVRPQARPGFGGQAIGWAGDDLRWAVNSGLVAVANLEGEILQRWQYPADSPWFNGHAASDREGKWLLVRNHRQLHVLSLPGLEQVWTRPLTPPVVQDLGRATRVACSPNHWAAEDRYGDRVIAGRIGGDVVVTRGGYPGGMHHYSTNGRVSVWTGYGPGSVMRIDHATGERSVRALPGYDCESVAVDAAGSVLVSIRPSDYKCEVVRLDPAGVEIERWPSGFLAGPVSFSPDGTTAALGWTKNWSGNRGYPTQVALQALGVKRLALIKAPGRLEGVVLTENRLYTANGQFLRAYSLPKAAELWRWSGPGKLDEKYYFFPGTPQHLALAVLASDVPV